MPAQPLNKEVLGSQLAELFVTQPTASKQEKAELQAEAPFWQNPPEAVIFASNSLRKALLLYWSMIAAYDVHKWPSFASHIPFDAAKIKDAFSIHHFFEENIHNGDGTVRQPFLIGFLPDGVPLYLCPTDGETSGNEDPVGESWNKIADIQQFFVGQDVIIFSSDAVQAIRTSGDAKLGKPENRAEFAQFGDDDAGIAAFKQWYIDTFYRVDDGEPLNDVHQTGLAGMRGETRHELHISMSVEVEERLLAAIDVCLQMGGGGVFQQLIGQLAAEDPAAWLRLQNPELTAYLESVDSELHPYIVVFHIMGMPAWTLPAFFEKLDRVAAQ